MRKNYFASHLMVLLVLLGGWISVREGGRGRCGCEWTVEKRPGVNVDYGLTGFFSRLDLV